MNDFNVEKEAQLLDTVRTFDPRMQFDSEDEKENASIVWASQSIDYVYQCINDGLQYRGQPFYRGKQGIRAPNLLYQYTEEELEEIIKCMDDINYFAERYVYLKNGREVSRITLRPYQKKLLEQYQAERFNIVLQARQTGKTTTTSIFLVWFCLFNADKLVAILAQKKSISKEVFDKVKGIIGMLPFFLKPGVIVWGAEEVMFDTGCRIITRALTPDCIQGYTVDVIFWDEVAYARNAEEVWHNIYPTISSIPDSKVFMTSTPNGKNYYWKLWDEALKKINKFVPYRVDYWEVEGRDEKWVEQEIANLGEAGFAQQYGLSFDAKEKQLLEADTSKFISKIAHKWKGYENLGTGHDSKFRWASNFLYDFQKDRFVVSVDVAEGLGKDFSTIKIWKMMPKFRGEYDVVKRTNNISYLNIGVFECNKISIKEFAYVIMRLLGAFDKSRLKLVIERNNYGDQLMNHMEYLAEHYPYLEIEFDTFAQFMRSKDAKLPEKGIRVNKDTKKVGVNMFKKCLQEHTIIETDEITIGQIKEFGENKHGTFQAVSGHDDLVMPIVNFAYYLDQDYLAWQDFCLDFLDELEDITYYNRSIAPNVKILDRMYARVFEAIKEESQKRGGIQTDNAKFFYDANEDMFIMTGGLTANEIGGISASGKADVSKAMKKQETLYETMMKAETKIVERNLDQMIKAQKPHQEIMNYAIEHERLDTKPAPNRYETWNPIRTAGAGYRGGYGHTVTAEDVMGLV